MEYDSHAKRFNALQDQVSTLYRWNAAAEAVITTFEAWINDQDDKTRYPRASHQSAKADASVQNLGTFQDIQWGNWSVHTRAVDLLLTRIAKLEGQMADDQYRPRVPTFFEITEMAANIRTAITIQNAWSLHLSADRQSELDSDFQSYVRALER